MKTQRERENLQKKGIKIMRMIRHYVVNKTTREAIYTHWSERECEKFLETLPDKENYAIGYKWLSL
jgi:hypothetical protein